MASLEIQKSAPSGAPAKAPEDTLLKNFRATLEKRWNEFDRATLQEAQQQVDNHPLGGFTDAKKERDKNADFINAKSTFDEAMQALNSIDTDAKLKQILETPGRLSSTINTLKDYLAKADKQKSYNTVLSHTLADLTGLKAQITEKPEDKKAAELAQAAVPALAVTTAGALATDTMTGLSDAIKDGAQSLKGEVSAVKNNPMKKIVEFFGFTESNILSDFKGALAEKKAGGFDGVFAGIKIWFYGFLAKLTGVDIAKSLTPEELKLAGIKGSVVPQNPEVKPEQAESKNDNLKYVASVEMLLKFGQSREERTENVLGIAGQILKEPKFSSLSIASLRKGYSANTKKFDISLLGENEKTIISSFPIDSQQKEKALHLIARLFFDTSNSIQAQVSASLLKSGDSVSIRSGILNGSKNLRKFTPFGSIDLSNPQAMLQEGAGKYIPTIDPTTNELTGELAEDFNSSMGKKNALWIFGYAKDQPVPLDTKAIDNHFQTDNPDLSKDPEDQKKLRQILQFGVDLRKVISNDTTLNLGEGTKVTNAIEKVFTLSDLGILYTFLDGKTNPTDMNSLEKGFLIMKIADMIQISNKELFGYYSTSIVNALLGIASPIDPKIKKVFLDMLGYATDKAGNVISDTAQVIWGSANKNPAAAIGLIAVMLFGPWFSKRGSIIGVFKK